MTEPNANIGIKSLYELYGKKFFIPDYQRGYKWKKQQIFDLLDDLWEFHKDEGNDFYCLQPLAVRKRFNLKDDKTSLDDLFEKIKTQTQDESEACEKLRKTRDFFIDSLMEKWEVIDGQQRLTTMFLILCYLSNEEGNSSAKEKLYTLEYETRENSQEYLNYFKNYNKKEQTIKELHDQNPDYHYIHNAYSAIEEWFGNKKNKINKDVKSTDKEEDSSLEPSSKIENSSSADVDIYKFTQDIKNKVNFIWYETEDRAIDVFTSLNIGKISLTNSELIKALLLNNDNFGESGEVLKSEISLEWDRIEKTLQDDEFWLFIHDTKYNKPARIDYIFDIICDKELLKKYNVIDNKKNIGNDKYRTFRYVNNLFKNKKKDSDPTKDLWECVKDIDATFNDWFNDLEMYHYVGYLIECKNKDAGSLYNEYNKSKNKTHTNFKDYIKSEIKKTIYITDKNDVDNLLDRQYERQIQSGSAIPKTKCRPILLLHNILSIIKQNKIIESADKFKKPVFYKFPFHLLKRDKWDVEHIDSNTTNDLHDNYSRLLWLIQYLNNENVKSDIENILKTANIQIGKVDRNTQIEFNDNSFELNSIEKAINESLDSKTHLNDLEKNKIWNFTLLDFNTNRSYGNSIFPSKRRRIAAKEKGEVMALYVEKENENYIFEFKKDSESSGVISFIPPVTRNVFMKYYTPNTSNFSYWDRSDAKAYREDIKTMLIDFLEEK